MKQDRDEPLPESSASTDGATPGSMGGASLADVKRGYTTLTEGDHAATMGCMCELCNPRGGFLGRPTGWER